VVRVTDQSKNGIVSSEHAAGIPSKLTAPRIERWVDVDDYPGYRVKLWVNYPRHLKSAFEPLDPDEVESLEGEDLERFIAERKAKVEEALAAIVLEHNGWPDEAGNVLPPPQAAGFWDAIPDQHLANVVLRLAVNAPSQLPNSRQPTRRR
jgi:hypothetical protein